jgi:hypothetical protein
MNEENELSSEAIVAIEACRPDSEDASLPEVASALAGESSVCVAGYRRSSERFDRAVTSAVRQVAVPEGLAERLLVGLAADSASEELLACPTDAEPTIDLAKDITRNNRFAWRSRRFALAGAVLATVASLLAVVFLRATRETPDTGDIQALARAFYESDEHRNALSVPPTSITLPVSSNTVLGYRDITLFERSGEAYELDAQVRGRHVKGTLYVVPLRSLWGPKLSGLPGSPVPFGTSGMTIAAWQSGSNAYVMVVQGDERAFWSFFVQKLA